MKTKDMQQQTPFKSCSVCNTKWQSRNAFLKDRQIRVSGYGAHFRDLELGLFFFDHLTCRNTLAIEAQEFTDFYDGPVFSERLTLNDSCPQYCLHKDKLDPCPNECECAYVRDVLHRIASWPKAGE
jgi:hypothetical protein